MDEQEEYEGYIRILTFIASIIAAFDASRSLIRLFFINAADVSFPFFHPAIAFFLLLISSLFLFFQSIQKVMFPLTEKVLLLFGTIFLFLGSVIAGSFLFIAYLIAIFS